jgi:hypothetical protein
MARNLGPARHVTCCRRPSGGDHGGGGDRRANLACAIGGLAYASTSRKVYRLLRDNDVLDAALRLDLKSGYGHEKLMERVAVGYLWGEDTLDSSRFKFIF